MKMYFKSGYEYKLEKNFYIQTNMRPGHKILTNYFRLDTDGFMVVFKNYSWDGPSGPTIDTKSFMRGSLVHDIAYQAIRENLLSMSHRKAADKELKRICLQDGMSKIRAHWVYTAVRLFGEKAALAENENKVQEAP